MRKKTLCFQDKIEWQYLKEEVDGDLVNYHFKQESNANIKCLKQRRAGNSGKHSNKFQSDIFLTAIAFNLPLARS